MNRFRLAAALAMGLCVLTGSWAQEPLPACPDLDRNGIVNFQELALIRQYFGQQSQDIPACTLQSRSIRLNTPPGAVRVGLFCSAGPAVWDFVDTHEGEALAILGLWFAADLCSTDCYRAVAYDLNGHIIDESTSQCFPDWDGEVDW